MLKGKMKIEMTDIHTGETNTVLEQNMVTDALSDFFKPLGLAKSPAKYLNGFAPYYQKPLGGLLLFDGQIEENAGRYYPPSTVNLVGCAAYNAQNNTTGKKRGGYNQTESELNLTERYMKYVYDFATSQANGTISCVCLTHRNGGYTSYGAEDAVFLSDCPLMIQADDGTLQYVYNNAGSGGSDYTGANTGDKTTGFTLGRTELLFAIDRNTDLAYYFRFDSGSEGTIISRRAYLRNVSVLENPYRQKALVDEVPVTGLNVSGRNAYCFDPASNSLYLFGADNSQTKAGDTFRIAKIELGTWKVTTYTMTNTADVPLYTDGLRYAFAHNGFAYIRSYSSPYTIYKFEIGNPANVAAIKNCDIPIGSFYPQFACNGWIYYEGSYSKNSSTYYGLLVLNEETNEFLKLENWYLASSSSHSYQCCFTPVIGEPMLYFVSRGHKAAYGFYLLTNYLATINNLSEPVTKTADKTMKITYIIQEQ